MITVVQINSTLTAAGNDAVDDFEVL